MHGVNYSHSNDIKIRIIAAAHLNAILISFVFKKLYTFLKQVNLQPVLVNQLASEQRFQKKWTIIVGIIPGPKQP